MLSSLLCALALFFIVVHLVTIAIATVRCRPRDAGAGIVDEVGLGPISIVRPLCNVETFSAETLAAALAVDYPVFEVLFCVAREDDPIVPLVEAAMAANPSVSARLLIGDDPISINPKLNNMVKGWREARHPTIAFIDSNVLTPPGFVRAIAATWGRETGVVSAPPVGCAPEGFGAHVECAFLNTFEARWQYVVDTFGFGFAQGKTLVYRKADLDRSAMRELASDPAEDAATTKMVRRMGRRVSLAPPSPQPLGVRPLRGVYARQQRWARLRRVTFLAEFLPEILSGSLIPIVCAALAAAAMGWPVPSSVAVYLAVWYGAELVMAAACRWPLCWATPLALVTRDVLMPIIWVGAFTSQSFTWNGTAVRMGSSKAPDPV